MQNRKPAPFNVVSDDPTGTTWALPEGAIARFGKGRRGSGRCESYLQMAHILPLEP